MKPFFRFSIFLVILFSFISCDPPHNIYFINQTDAQAKIKIKVNPKAENNDLRQMVEGDSIVFNLKARDTAALDFGIGVWDDNEIDFVVNAIEKMEVETKDIKTTYKSK